MISVYVVLSALWAIVPPPILWGLGVAAGIIGVACLVVGMVVLAREGSETG